MELRPQLLPPRLDEAKVARLADLAAEIDDAHPAHWQQTDAALAEFNKSAQTELTFEDFQGISGGEEHQIWIRRVLNRQCIRPAPDVTREELVEVVRRAMPQTGDPDYEAYMAIFDANVPLAAASNLIFYPLDYDAGTNTWGGGRPMGEYDPSPDQIVEWALTRQRR